MDRLLASFGYSVVTTLFLTLVSLPFTMAQAAAHGTAFGAGDVLGNVITMLMLFTFVFYELQSAFERQNEEDRKRKERGARH